MPTGFDYQAMRRALERVDPETLVTQLADDIVYEQIDAQAPPSAPRVIRGKSAMAELASWLQTSEIEMRLTDEVIGADRVAWTTDCRFPDGRHIVGITVAAISDGLISRMREVQVSDR
jgi:SnoaL-like domain